MDALGKRLVKSLIVEQDISVVRDMGITRSDFFGEARDAYEYAVNYFESSGEWPTEVMVTESSGVTFAEDLDPLSYISDKIRSRSLSKKLEVNLTNVAELLESKNPDEALKELKKVASDTSYLKAAETISHRKTGLDRYELHEILREKGHLFGVATPWDSINTLIQRFLNGTLSVIMGMQNVGKSWAAVIIANYSFLEGKTVLFVTMEMSVERMQRRLDSAMYKIPFINIRDSTISPEDEKIWKSKLEADLEGTGDVIFADKRTVKYVSDVTALVFRYNPDIVVIDGGYRFQSETSKEGWESTSRIVGDLQTTAEMTDIPWVVTTQYGDSDEKGRDSKRGPKMRAWGVRYGKEWVINPDIVLGLYQNEDLRLMKLSEIHVMKIRDAAETGLGNVISINWDMTKMDFSESGSSVAAPATREDDHIVAF